MIILGISAFYHDSAAAIIADGKIIAAAQEERFSRVKHDLTFLQLNILSLLRGIYGWEFQSSSRYKAAYEEIGFGLNSVKGRASNKCYISTNTKI